MKKFLAFLTIPLLLAACASQQTRSGQAAPTKKFSLTASANAASTATPSGTRPALDPIAYGPSTNVVPLKEATLQAGRRGAYIALKPQGTLTVELNANAAAGYRWKLAEPLDPAVLQLVSPTGSEPQPVALSPDRVTSPQAEKWVFKAVGPGTTKVRMSYSKPHQPLNQTVYYDFTVNAE